MSKKKQCKHRNDETGTCNELWEIYCRNCSSIKCETCSIETDGHLKCVGDGCPLEVTENAKRGRSGRTRQTKPRMYH